MLSRKDINGQDGLISLFTKEYGKVMVRAKSIRKITSKLSHHFQPLSFVKARFVPRVNTQEGFVLMDGVGHDAFSDADTKRRTDLIPVMNFLDDHLFPYQPDERLWTFLTTVFTARFKARQAAWVLLTIIGFDPVHSSCGMCGHKNVVGFCGSGEYFVCSSCASRFAQHEVLWIEGVVPKIQISTPNNQ